MPCAHALRGSNKMNASDFQQCAERTMLANEASEHLMTNAALGLCGEAAEIDEIVLTSWGHTPIKLLEEAGDLLWYVAQMCKAINISIAQFPPAREIFEGQDAVAPLYRNAGIIADVVKKQVFHQRATPNEAITSPLWIVVSAITCLLEQHGFTIEQAFDHNHAKILKRHPDGFTCESANARRDEAQP